MRKNREDGRGLHEIENKRRPRAVKDKKGLRLTNKRKMRRVTKAIAAVSVVAVAAIGFSVGSAFFREASRNAVNLDYGSPMTAVAEGEIFEEGKYSGAEIFARLNWTFAQQTSWYGEMHGTVNAAVVQQEISTYKQYSDGILISADLTRSSLVSGASQFCYLKDLDRVMWRKPAGNSSTYNGLDTVWKTGEPYRSMTIGGPDGFKAQNGLPAYELSVYVIEEDTIMENGTHVEALGGGRYKVTYNLKPEIWQEEDENGNLITKGATAYYANQMIFTGGLPEAPTFNEITVSFTFDENWVVYRTDIDESYNAKYGVIAAPCSSVSYTEYQYNTPLAHSDAYEDYFKQYVDAEVTNGPVKEDPTALDCLATAFGSVLTDPTVLNLDLTVNGTPVNGVVNLDLSKTNFTDIDLSLILAKVRLGALRAWVEDGTVYLSYGGLKLSLGLNETVSLIKDLTEKPAPEAEGGPETEEGEGEQDLLAALANGRFLFEGDRAELHSELPLLGMNLPVDFYFRLDGEGNASLDHVSALIEAGETTIGAQVVFGNEKLPELSAQEKGGYAELVPYVRGIAELFTGEGLNADLSYKSPDGGISAAGTLRLSFEPLVLEGSFRVDAETKGIVLHKALSLSYAENEICLDLDGIRVSADVNEAVALLSEYLDLGSGKELPFDLGNILLTLLSEDFAGNFSSREEENSLRLLVKGTELLSAFGVSFDLGEAELTLGETTLGVKALGAEIAVSGGGALPLPETEGYVPVLPYAKALIDLFGHEDLTANLTYGEEGGFTAEGELSLNLSRPAAKGVFTVGYGEAKQELTVVYGEGYVCVGLGEIRIKANFEDAAALVGSLLGTEEDASATELLNRLLALDFGSVIALGEDGNALRAVIEGTELLKALGVSFDLGKAELTVSEGRVEVRAAGAEISVVPGEPFTAETDGYIDILPYAEKAAALLSGEAIGVEARYESGKFTAELALDLDLRSLTAKGSVALTYGEGRKELELVLADGAICLGLGGIRVKADLDEAIALVGEYVSLPASDMGAREILEKILGLDLSGLLTLTEEKDELHLALEGTKLLEAFGIGFELGKVEVTFGEDIRAEAHGVQIGISEGKAFEASADGYIDIVKYARTVADMIAGGYLSADVSYSGGGLTVGGNVKLSLDPLSAEGTLDLAFGGIRKTVYIAYADGGIFLSCEGIRVKADAESAVSLLKEYLSLPAEDEGAEDLLERLFKLDLNGLVTVKEAEGTLSLAIAGGRLLEAFGLGFDLGEVNVSVGGSGLNVTLAGAEIALAAGGEFTPDTYGYIDIVRYADTVLGMLSGGYLAADVSYSEGKLALSGSVKLSLDPLAAEADLSVVYGAARQDLSVSYAEGRAYLAFGQIRLSASVSDLSALVGQLLGTEEGSAESDLLERVLSIDLSRLVSLGERDGVLSLALAGNTLFEALGVQIEGFEPGEVNLFVDSSSVRAEAFGVRVSVTPGESFTPDTAGYIDIGTYAETVAKLVSADAIHAEISYAKNGLTVQGGLDLALASLTARAELTLSYEAEAGGAKKTISRTVGIVYGDDLLCLDLEGAKVSVTVSNAISLVKGLLGMSEEEGEETDLIETLLGLDFEKLLTLREAEGELSLTVAGNELLGALGADFSLGDIALTVSDTVGVSALGARIELSAGEAFRAETEGYRNLDGVLGRIGGIIEEQALSFGGEITVTVGTSAEESGTTITLLVEDGGLSWSEETGLCVKLNASLAVSSAILNFNLSADGEKLRLVYGGLAAEIVYGEIGGLKAAFENAYGRIYSFVQKMLVEAEGNDNPLPAFDELLSSLKGGEAAGGALETLLGGDWIDFVNSVVLSPSAAANGIFGAEAGNWLFLELTEEQSEKFGGFAAAELTVDRDGLYAGAKLFVDGFRGFPEYNEPERYLGIADFADAIDYIGALVGLLEQQDLNFAVEGKIYSSDAAYEQFGGVKYDFTARLDYNCGGTFPFFLDRTTNNFYIDPDIFFKLGFALEAKSQADKSVFIDLVAVDSDLSGAKNGMLDFYVTVSTVGEGDEGYEPLRVYAPGEELLTVLAGAADMFGLESDFLENYFIRPWLGALGGFGEDRAEASELVERLRVLGESILRSIASGKEEGEGSGSEVPAEPSAPAAPQAKDYIRSVTVEEGALSLALNGEALFGKGSEDLVVRLEKETGENSLLKGLSLTGVRSGEGGADVSLAITRNAFDRTWNTPPVYPAKDGYFSVQGVDKLVLALAKTATHRATEEEIKQNLAKAGEFLRNDQFYIDGNIALDITLPVIGKIEDIGIAVKGLAVNFDEKGDIGLNAQLAYEATRNGAASLLGDAVIIKGDTVLDLTLKSGMLYMRRTQTTHFDGNTERDLQVPEVIYRALPLSNFMKDYMNQICFMFNFSETLMNRIMSMAGGGSGGTAEKPKDIGGLFRSYVNDCTLEAKDRENMTFTLKANGEGLTGSSQFSEIPVVLGVENGYLSTIDANLTIASVVHGNANLRLRNPEGKFESGYSDLTTDVSAIIARAMDAKLKDPDWDNTNYLEGQLTTVTYWIDGEQIGSQEVIFDPTTHESFAKLVAPDLTQYLGKQPGRTPVWDLPADGKITADLKIYAKYRANDYHLVFRSEEQIAAAEGLGYTETYSDEESVWLYEREWTYGTEIELPFGATNEREIVYFECEHGHHYLPGDDLTLHIYTEETITFTAHWDYINYTVTFRYGDGKTATQTGHYGEPIAFPEDTGREGYAFGGWDLEEKTITGSLTFTAQYTPRTYTLTLVSDRALEGFTLEEGDYVRRIDYTFGTALPLPEVNTVAEGFILNGWCLEEGSEDYLTEYPALAGDRTLYARWTEKGFEVEFVAEGKPVATRDYHFGDTLTNLPTVPERAGYRGAWDIPEGYTVREDGVIHAKYTPITYVIYGLSRFNIDGFKKITETFDSEDITGTEFYYTRYEYVYGTHQGETGGYHLREGLSESQRRYDFGGWYTTRFGTSNHGEATKVEYMNDGVIENVFHFNVGDGNDDSLEGKNILYADWIDNSVDVVLYSDFDFDGRTGNALVGESTCYYKTVTLMGGSEADYDVTNLEIAPYMQGLTRLGWWYEDPQSGWRQVENVNEFRNDDTRVQATVKLFALWIEEIQVRITKMTPDNPNAFSTYGFAGVVKGGKISGATSSEIGKNFTSQTDAQFKIYKEDGREDTLADGDTFAIGETGTFEVNGKTSGKSFLWNGADYGGVVVTVTFRYTDGDGNAQSATTSWSAIVSYQKYRVRVLDENGGELESVEVRKDYPLDEDDNSILVSDVVNGSELYGFEKVEIPEKRGYTGRWNTSLDTRITGDTEIRAAYSPNTYKVTFISDEYLGEGWVMDGADYKYRYVAFMEYGSTVLFRSGASEEELEGGGTVTDDDEQTFTLPQKPLYEEKYEGKWQASINTQSAIFTVLYDLDTIIYESAVLFTADGLEKSVDSLTKQYTEDSALLVPKADGYTFLGWYQFTNGGWVEWTELKHESETMKVTLQALWMSDLTVTLEEANHRSTGLIFKTHYYSGRATIEGGKLVGAACKDGATVSMSYRYSVSDNQNSAGSVKVTNSYRVYQAEDTCGEFEASNSSYLHVNVNIEYTLFGKTYSVKEGHASKSF